MARKIFSLILIVAGCFSFWFAGASQQTLAGDKENEARSRREITDPGLILETGARTAACDVLTFTPDGSQLLATGDDKVVRVWDCTPTGLDPKSAQVLRWGIYRERRGSIYALALSSDGRSVAVGGFGLRRCNLAVIDRQSGAIQHAAVPSLNGTIWAVAFSPRDNQVAFGADDGSVWLWDLQGRRGSNLRRLGRHPGKGFNHVRLVSFLDNGQVLSVAASGQVAQWSVSRTDAAPAEVFRFRKVGNLFRVAIDPRRKWLAAAGQQAKGKSVRVVEVRSLDGAQSKVLDLPQDRGNHYAHCLAFDAAGERLAVGTYCVPQNARFHKVTHGEVFIYDLKQSAPRPVSGPKGLTWYVDALAFHPGGKYLAVAGGDDYEVTLWDLARPGKAISEIRSRASCLWGVALSPDGRYLGYLDRRRWDPPHPNRRGQGDWKVFDLHRRRWLGKERFRPLPPRESEGGWKVATNTGSGLAWSVVGRSNKRYRLPLNPALDDLPQCYTFLKARKGKVRVAVGHYWGISVFELGKRGAKLVRKFTGHQGPVTALAVSANQKVLVSASRDQTIAAWSLEDWPSQPELGARFAPREGKLVVEAVDAGSPAWEAGLTRADEIVRFAYGGKEVFGGAESWLKVLRRPEPGLECWFTVKRRGLAGPVILLTTVRQRPLWQFFPTRDQEWVLWRCRDYYYDTSTRGDFNIGWQISRDVDGQPHFFKAEQFRRQFHRPAKVSEVLTGMVHNTQRVSMPDMEPPEVKLEVGARVVKDTDLVLKLSARATGQRTNHKLDEVMLWVNDYRILHKTLTQSPGTFQETVVIPRAQLADKLRRGTNLLTFQCYNKARGRGQTPSIKVEFQQPATPATLYGLFAGIGDYKRAKPFEDLKANQDASELWKTWSRQKGRLYKKVVARSLLNQEVTATAILRRLAALETQVKPDDQLVVFLGGHGVDDEELVLGARERKIRITDDVLRGSFWFCCADFRIARPNRTGLTMTQLYDALSRLCCHKLVLLDTCHSGWTTRINPVRDLSVGGLGPVTLAACGARESAREHPFPEGEAVGLFTIAVIRALTEGFEQADRNKDRTLDAGELAHFVKQYVLEQFTELKEAGKARKSDRQTPTYFIPDMERGRQLVGKVPNG